MYLLNALGRTLPLASGRSASVASRRRTVCAGLAGTALTITACGGQAASVVLPPKGHQPTVTPAALSGPAHTPKQAVAAAYRGYWRAYAAAMTAGNAARAKRILAPYNAPGGLPQLIKSLKVDWAAHDVAYGGAITHVKSVQITGTRAILHDCLDLSHFGALDKKSGRVVPTSFGLPDLDYYISLVLTAGRWKVSNMQPVEVPCKP
jgi:hypothetical protein